MAHAEPSPYVTVDIPRGNLALGPLTPDASVTHDTKIRAALERDLSPVDALSDAPYQDAVEVALDAPPMPAFEKPQRPIHRHSVARHGGSVRAAAPGRAAVRPAQACQPQSHGHAAGRAAGAAADPAAAR